MRPSGWGGKGRGIRGVPYGLVRGAFVRQSLAHQLVLPLGLRVLGRGTHQAGDDERHAEGEREKMAVRGCLRAKWCLLTGLGEDDIGCMQFQ